MTHDGGRMGMQHFDCVARVAPTRTRAPCVVGYPTKNGGWGEIVV